MPTAGYFSPAELARYRTLQHSASTGRGTILRRQDTPAGAGGTAIAWVTLAAQVPLRLAPSQYQAGEPIIGERQAGVESWDITLTDPATFAAFTVRPEDRIRIGDRTFEVVDAEGPASYETARRINALEIR